MFTLQNYHYATSLQDAYEVLQSSKHNVILGGLLWLKMNKKQYHTGIDLTNLGLDTILDQGEVIEIGACTTLRQLETSPLLQNFAQGIIPESVKSIVGVQFRNGATLGGSIYSRFGFSDVITALLALNCQVELYHAGTMSLEAFLDNPPARKDILVKIILDKNTTKGVYNSCRLSATDLPILTFCMTCGEKGYRIAIGARPHRAKLAHKTGAILSTNPTDEEIETASACILEELTYGSNMRGSAAYRKTLAKVFVKRGVRSLCN